MIPYGTQNISPEDIEAVEQVLKSDYLTQGPACPLFEERLAQTCEAKHAVAVNSATSALHLACLALGLGKGDILWTSPISFVASANCALYCDAEVDFVDIDPRTYTLDPDKLLQKLEKAASENKLPKIVIPVHFAGQSCDMEKIHALSQQYGFKIIEDAAHAIGGTYKDKMIGSCVYSDITIFSFHPVKIITTGEGGAALTNSKELYEKISLLRSHGIERDFPGKSEAEPWIYQQTDLGYNYRMTDISAALGLSQLSQLSENINQRHKLAERYDLALDDLDVTCPYQSPESRSAYHLYPILLETNTISRAELFVALRQNGIGTQIHYIPIHTQPYYRKLGFDWGDFPVAENYYNKTLTLPLHTKLTNGDQDKIVDNLRSLLG